MTIGIWTPVPGSTKVVAFGPNSLRFFADRIAKVSLVSGTHVMFQVLGCFPVFIHTIEPTIEAAGTTGVPVGPGAHFVLPASTEFWIYSPYEVVTVIATIGTLT